MPATLQAWSVPRAVHPVAGTTMHLVEASRSAFTGTTAPQHGVGGRSLDQAVWRPSSLQHAERLKWSVSAARVAGA